ncbi:hypothetical protein AQUCO_02500003v1 [Aquilegia coerulea]|uniref:Uncharacterized protein n=1 Tax=Aquilegia coerulea TaxID=218851 RepID=A0A2G5D8Z6_AQUCA|nr:hypothetical protein AQUCO_02500003v1 [Aquilegia coerulea]
MAFLQEVKLFDLFLNFHAFLLVANENEEAVRYAVAAKVAERLVPPCLFYEAKVLHEDAIQGVRCWPQLCFQLGLHCCPSQTE